MASNSRFYLSILCLMLIEGGHSSTWNITGSGDWSDALNWTPNYVPNGVTAADDAIFGSVITSDATISIPSTFAIRNLSFVAPGNNYTLSGGTLNASPTTGITVTGTNAHTIESNFNYLTTLTINQGSSLPLTFSGPVSGSLAISKTGTGELIFSGSSPNNFTGLITISAGTVTLDKSAGVPATSGSITVSSAGCTLKLNNSEQFASGAVVTLSNATAAFDLNGYSTTISNLTVSTTGTYNLGGTLLLNSSATALTLTNNPIINGQLVLTNGTGGNVSKTTAGTGSLENIELQNGVHDFTISGGTTILDITGVISGNGGLSKSSTGTLSMSGNAINTYSNGTLATSGTLSLNRTAPGICIPGDLTIAGGTVILQANQQIAPSSNMTMTSGTFNMNAFTQAISSLNMQGGTLTNNTGGGLTLNSTNTALTMRNTTITGQIFLTGASGGSVVFDQSNNGTATLTNIDLGSTDRIFNIGEGTATFDMVINGTITGNGGLIKTGSGSLEFITSISNNYLGQTTVSEGSLILARSGAISIPNDLLINGGLVQMLTFPNQISNSSNVVLNSGTFDLNNQTNTVNSFTFNGGTFNFGTAQLSLASTATALTMKNTTINGTINLTGASGGSVVFDNSNNGTATILNINLGTADRIFDIPAGNQSSSKMVLQGSSGSGAAIIKQGSGVLELLGTHTYTLSTTQVLNGTLLVNGILTCPTLIISSDGEIKGSGTINSNITSNGTIRPGNSIGTISLVGNQTLGSTSIYEVEFDQFANDLIDITGSLTINNGATLTLLPQTSNFSTPLTQTIIQTTTGVTGTFTNINNPLLFYTADILYSGNNVLLQLTAAPFSNVPLTGNALVVANYLDQLNVPVGSDLYNIEEALRNLNSASEVEAALLQLQPSYLKGLALTEENNAFQIQSRIFNRVRKSPCSPVSCKPNVWGFVNVDFYNQASIGSEISFKTISEDVLIGVDKYVSDSLQFGLVGAYSHSSTRWHRGQLHGIINTGSLSTYVHAQNETYYLTALALGAGNFYDEKREINFSTIQRTAHGEASGCQFAVNLEVGGNFWKKELEITPFLSGQFMYIYMGRINEKGAESLNLNIYSSDYSLFRGEGGFDFSHCGHFGCQKVAIDLRLSYIFEQRFAGKKFTSSLQGYNSVFTVKGMNPTFNKFSPALDFSFISEDNRKKLTLGYSAEIGPHFLDQAAVTQMSIAF